MNQAWAEEVAWILRFFVDDVRIWSGYSRSNDQFRLQNISFAPSVLKFQPFNVKALLEEKKGQEGTLRLRELRVDGYRALEGFEAQLGPLTVVIGANATGKSSLFSLLSFVSFAAVNPLPPEIDPNSVGRMLFHMGGPERISFSLLVEREASHPLRYTVDVRGPVGSPTVAAERLVSLPTDGANRPKEAFAFLDFTGGRGIVRSMGQAMQNPWGIPANELALRRALDPNLVMLNRFRDYVGGWKLYTGFEVGMASSIRRPVPTEPEPTLKEDGSNLTAVLASLMTEHTDRWEELETHLGSAIPAFQSLRVKFKGGPGMAIGVWRESGVNGELTLADLSDGTLRFLCWATLCLSPHKPPLICIDEPELGLHPPPPTSTPHSRRAFAASIH
jgi:predicted ATPase